MQRVQTPFRFDVMWRVFLLGTGLLFATPCRSADPPQVPPTYNPKPVPTRYITTLPGNHPVAVFKMLVDRTNFDNSVEIAELTQEPGFVPPHTHDSNEFFYVQEGLLVNTVQRRGDSKLLPYCIQKGEIGAVRTGDVTTHEAKKVKLVSIVVWAPGGEADRFLRSGRFQELPYQEDKPNPFDCLVKIPPKTKPDQQPPNKNGDVKKE